jgi:peptide deformylase
MILPVVAFGDPVLRKVAEDIDQNYPGIQDLIANMFDTMDEADGVGLAAPQVGLPIRLFVIDMEIVDEEKFKGVRKAFINAHIVDESEEMCDIEEGCLSIPKVRAQVRRPEKIKVKYLDEHFVAHEEWFDDFTARVIQHEYDHIEGILFIDHLSALKRNLFKKKLDNISTGNVQVTYKMKFPKAISRRL